MTKAAALLGEYEQELPTTRRFLERLPAERLTWKPHDKSMSAGQLALHIAETPSQVLRMLLADQASPPDTGNSRQQPSSLASVLAALDQGSDFVRQTLPTLDDRRMGAIVHLSVGGQLVASAPREALLRTIMFNHFYHHRGQFGVYLRLLGVPVPSSYGPSGDESPF